MIRVRLLKDHNAPHTVLASRRLSCSLNSLREQSLTPRAYRDKLKKVRRPLESSTAPYKQPLLGFCSPCYHPASVSLTDTERTSFQIPYSYLIFSLVAHTFTRSKVAHLVRQHPVQASSLSLSSHQRCWSTRRPCERTCTVQVPWSGHTSWSTWSTMRRSALKYGSWTTMIDSVERNSGLALSNPMPTPPRSGRNRITCLIDFPQRVIYRSSIQWAGFTASLGSTQKIAMKFSYSRRWPLSLAPSPQTSPWKL